MEYVVIRRFKGKCIGGVVNLPYGTVCHERGGVIYVGDTPICYTTSQIAYDFFARNDDGCGLKRGELTRDIIARLSKQDADHQNRWNKIWKNARLKKFKRIEHDDFWVWNFDFYNAPISELQYIQKIVRG